MAIPTSFRAKRIAARHAEPMQQVLVFRLRQDWFALPAIVAQRVIQVDQLYGNTPGSIASLALYQDREIPVIDIKQRIFGIESQKLLSGAPLVKEISVKQSEPSYYLLIVPNAQQEPIGLLLDWPPILKRVPQSSFTPLSSTYLAEGHIRCATALIVTAPDKPPIFLLDFNQLIPSQMALPAGE